MIIVFNENELVVDGFEVRMVEVQKEFNITNGGHYNAITEIELYKNNEQVDVEDCRIVSDELVDKIEVIINDMIESGDITLNIEKTNNSNILDKFSDIFGEEFTNKIYK